jgi:cobyrinic acid a,c-diamide synthase
MASQTAYCSLRKAAGETCAHRKSEMTPRDEVLQWLEEAYQQRVFRIIELTMPMFDGLRSDMRWQDLVRRIGLPQ